MKFAQSFYNGQLLFPNFEFDTQQIKIIGIQTNVQRKQFLTQYLQEMPNVYLQLSQDGIYERLTVKEYLQFLIQLSGHTEKVDHLMQKFELLEIQKTKVKFLTTSQRKYIQLLNIYFAHQSIIAIEEPYFYLEDRERLLFKRVLENIQKFVLILTSNLEDAIISCDAIYRLTEQGLQQFDIAGDEVENEAASEEPVEQQSIKIEKIPTRKNDKVILFNPPEIDYIESLEGSIYVHVSGTDYVCAMTLTELEQRLVHYGFFRCHRSYIVNLQKVREIITWTKNSYSLRLNVGKDAVVPLSRTKLQQLKTLLNI